MVISAMLACYSAVFLLVVGVINPNIPRYLLNKITRGRYAKSRIVIEQFLELFEKLPHEFTLNSGYIKFPAKEPKIKFTKSEGRWTYILPDGDIKHIDTYYASKFDGMLNYLESNQDLGAIKRILSNERLMLTCT